MGRYEKLIKKILEGKTDKNISFSSIRQLMIHLGFEERIRGSHHIFRKADIEEKNKKIILGENAIRILKL